MLDLAVLGSQPQIAGTSDHAGEDGYQNKAAYQLRSHAHIAKPCHVIATLRYVFALPGRARLPAQGGEEPQAYRKGRPDSREDCVLNVPTL